MDSLGHVRTYKINFDFRLVEMKQGKVGRDDAVALIRPQHRLIQLYSVRRVVPIISRALKKFKISFMIDSRVEVDRKLCSKDSRNCFPIVAIMVKKETLKIQPFSKTLIQF